MWIEDVIARGVGTLTTVGPGFSAGKTTGL